MGNLDREQVVLSIESYNKFKSAAVRADLVIDRLFELAEFEGGELVFNKSGELTNLLKLAYPKRYSNRVDAMIAEQLAIKCNMV